MTVTRAPGACLIEVLPIDYLMRNIIIQYHRTTISGRRGCAMNDRAAGKAPVRVTAADGRRRLDSIDLLGCGNESIIAHGGEEYRLRLTRQGKLILTK